jgi:hypothetical protein
MLPMPPMMFPHPAQLQAMGAAAQAAMAHAAKQPGGMPACFPMGMFPPPPMMQQQQQQGSAGTTCMQQQQPCSTSSQPASPAAAAGPTAAAAAAAAADDEDDVVPDEDVEVEPELEQIFEKVAAMERAHKAAMVAVQVRRRLAYLPTMLCRQQRGQRSLPGFAARCNAVSLFWMCLQDALVLSGCDGGMACSCVGPCAQGRLNTFCCCSRLSCYLSLRH